MFNIFKNYPKTKYYKKNEKGKDYVVGDIHGEFLKLEEKLKSINFNPKTDRLFSVGDLTDRGSSSISVLDWINRKWFIPVKGNHEDMLIKVSKTIFTETAVSFYHNGGKWFFDIDKKKQKKIANYYKTFPTTITVDTINGPIGIVHADCPTPTWKLLNEFLNSKNFIDIEKKCLWSRERLRTEDQIIPDVRAVIIGHMKQEVIKKHGNVFFIDTGSGYTDGYLTILDLETLNPV